MTAELAETDFALPSRTPRSVGGIAWLLACIGLSLAVLGVAGTHIDANALASAPSHIDYPLLIAAMFVLAANIAQFVISVPGAWALINLRRRP